MKQKTRIDILMVELGHASSRERAQALILSGNVLVDNIPIDKPGIKINRDSELRIRGQVSKYVGRGGDKLEGALNNFSISLLGKIAADIGSSTGGFTDCMLQRGVKKVFAIDVGSNQLDYKIRCDSRVVVKENTHVLDLTKDDFDELPELCTVDLSFISVKKILPHLVNLFSEKADFLILIKPQFELEPEFIKKGGIVKSKADSKRAVESVKKTTEELGLNVEGIVPSVLKGAKSGNQEYFLYAVAHCKRKVV